MNNTKVFLRRTGRYESRTQHDVDATMHTIRVSGTVFQDLELEEIEPFRAILGTYHPSETEHSDDKLGLLNMYCTVPDNFQYLKAYFQGDSSRFDYRVRVNMLSYPAKYCKEVLGSNGREHKYYFEIQTV